MSELKRVSLTNDVIEMLESLARYEGRVAGLVAAEQEAVENAIPAEVKAEIEKIHATYDGKDAEEQRNIAVLRDEIKEAVINLGHTVRASTKMAVWNKPRATVNITKLIGYAAAHPEVESLINYGEPSVTIRKA